MIKLNNSIVIIIIILLLPLYRHAYCAIEAFFIKLNKIYLLINFIINILFNFIIFLNKSF